MTGKKSGASATDDKTDPLAQAEAAGLDPVTIVAAHMAANPGLTGIEALELRVARLETTLYGLLNEHFKGKVPALADPPPLE